MNSIQINKHPVKQNKEGDIVVAENGNAWIYAQVSAGTFRYIRLDTGNRQSDSENSPANVRTLLPGESIVLTVKV